MGRRNIVRRKGKGKTLSVVDAGGGGDERRFQQRWSRAQVVETEGGDGEHNASRQAGESGVKDAVAGSNAAIPAATKDGPQDPVVEPRRIRKSHPGGKVVVLCW